VTDSIVQKKSYEFALKLVRLYKTLLDKRETVLSKQMMRSGMAIGANVEEALAAQTRREFHSKMTIAFKESRETRYWLRLIRDSGFVNQDLSGYVNDVEELIRILSAITKTTSTRKDRKERGEASR
jgi:four helix bundle protein